MNMNNVMEEIEKMSKALDAIPDANIDASMFALSAMLQSLAARLQFAAITFPHGKDVESTLGMLRETEKRLRDLSQGIGKSADVIASIITVGEKM